jgi:hypothetical protein
VLYFAVKTPESVQVIFEAAVSAVMVRYLKVGDWSRMAGPTIAAECGSACLAWELKFLTDGAKFNNYYYTVAIGIGLQPPESMRSAETCSSADVFVDQGFMHVAALIVSSLY